MKFRHLAAAAIAALLFAIAPASANVINMCQGDVSGASTGSRTIGGSLSAVPSGTTYVLNGAGCANILAQDVGYFLSQGYTLPSGLPSMQIVIPTTATGTTAFQIGTLPPNAAIVGVYASNTDASHAVTGGINIGSTSGGNDIVAGANFSLNTATVNAPTQANIATRLFSTTAGQAIFTNAVTSWNTPTTVTITVSYTYF
jgi:hypothetical protein